MVNIEESNDKSLVGHTPKVPVARAAMRSQDHAEARDLGQEKAAKVFEINGLHAYYGDFCALRDVQLDVHQSEVTAFIGPSGCGKSTFLRCFNRMNDLIEGARVDGEMRYHGLDLYDQNIDAVEVRRRIGMVFQKPNPFPKSIYDNVAFGPRIGGVKKSELDNVVEKSLRRAALWDEVKDRLEIGRAHV